MSTTHETFLGDGLYASHDGHQFILRAPRFSGGKFENHQVALEPAVMSAFLRFVESVTNTRVTVERLPDQSPPAQAEVSTGRCRCCGAVISKRHNLCLVCSGEMDPEPDPEPTE